MSSWACCSLRRFHRVVLLIWSSSAICWLVHEGCWVIWSMAWVRRARFLSSVTVSSCVSCVFCIYKLLFGMGFKG